MPAPPARSHLWKVLLLAVVPFAAFVIFAVYVVRDSLRDMEVAAHMGIDTDRLETASRLIGELQLERGRSLLYGAGHLDIASMTRQQQVTDHRWHDMATVGVADGDDGAAAVLDHDLLLEVRRRVASGSGEVFAVYTAMIASLTDFQARLLRDPLDIEARVAYRNTLLLESAREYAGRLRALGSSLLAADRPLDSGQLMVVLAAHSAIEPLLDVRALDLPAPARAWLGTRRQATPWVAANEAIHRILQHSEEGDYGIEPLRFFADLSVIVSDLGELARGEIERMRQQRRAAHDRAAGRAERALLAIAVISLFLLVQGLDYRASLAEQRRAYARLELEEARHEMILTAAGEGIVGLDEGGRVTFANDAALKMLGRAPTEVLRQPAHALMHDRWPEGSPYPEAQCPVLRTLADGVVHRCEDEVFWRKDGTSFPIEYVSTPVHEDNKVTGAVVVFTDITKRRQAEKRELEIGHEIQKALLLGPPPEQQDLPAVAVAAETKPSLGVDGDFYDFITHGPHVFDVLFGDVMGKGLPAALVAAGAKSFFMRSLARLLSALPAGQLPEPDEIVQRAHGYMTGRLATLDSFVSLHYARFDLAACTMRLVNCGHTPVLHFQAGRAGCTQVTVGNMPLGIHDRPIFAQITVPFAVGDVFVFYSDGVTEARNPQGGFYGADRLARLVVENQALPPRELLARLRADLETFTATNVWRDDVSCVVIKILPAAGSVVSLSPIVPG